MRNQSIDSKLLFAKNAMVNAETVPKIKTAIADLGYDEAKMLEGKGLYTKAAELQAKQVMERGEQFAATDILNLAKENTNKVYMKHVKIARIALKNDRGTGESLQIAGRRKESFSGWLKQAKAFYTNGLNTPKVESAMTKYGITKKKLSETKAIVEDVEIK